MGWYMTADDGTAVDGNAIKMMVGLVVTMVVRSKGVGSVEQKAHNLLKIEGERGDVGKSTY